MHANRGCDVIGLIEIAKSNGYVLLSRRAPHPGFLISPPRLDTPVTAERSLTLHIRYRQTHGKKLERRAVGLDDARSTAGTRPYIRSAYRTVLGSDIPRLQGLDGCWITTSLGLRDAYTISFHSYCTAKPCQTPRSLTWGGTADAPWLFVMV